MQKVKVKGQLVRKIEWKQMDRWMELIALPSMLKQSLTVFVQIVGVGYSLNAKLSSLGVSTCSDLQKLSMAFLQKQFGMKTGQTLYKCCRGTDDRPFRTGMERKSISAEMNYAIRFNTVVNVKYRPDEFSGFAVSCSVKQLRMIFSFQDEFLLCIQCFDAVGWTVERASGV